MAAAVKLFECEATRKRWRGVNADFPFSRRYGLIAEGTYHWLHTKVRQRFVTLTAGLRISF